MDPTVLAATAGNVARHLPHNADPRLARVTLEQLPTITSRLAGDDPSLVGDPRISQRKGGNRDGVGHILGRRLASDPGARFATRRPIDGLARPLLQWVAEPARRPP